VQRLLADAPRTRPARSRAPAYREGKRPRKRWHA
jgi:hypothetical protein